MRFVTVEAVGQTLGEDGTVVEIGPGIRRQHASAGRSQRGPRRGDRIRHRRSGSASGSTSSCVRPASPTTSAVRGISVMSTPRRPTRRQHGPPSQRPSTTTSLAGELAGLLGADVRATSGSAASSTTRSGRTRGSTRPPCGWAPALSLLYDLQRRLQRPQRSHPPAEADRCGGSQCQPHVAHAGSSRLP